MTQYDVDHARCVAWLAEHPHAADALERIMGEDAFTMRFLTGDDARRFDALFGEPTENVLVMSPGDVRPGAPIVLVNGDGIVGRL